MAGSGLRRKREVLLSTYIFQELDNYYILFSSTSPHRFSKNWNAFGTTFSIEMILCFPISPPTTLFMSLSFQLTDQPVSFLVRQFNCSFLSFFQIKCLSARSKLFYSLIAEPFQPTLPNFLTPAKEDEAKKLVDQTKKSSAN